MKVHLEIIIFQAYLVNPIFRHLKFRSREFMYIPIAWKQCLLMSEAVQFVYRHQNGREDPGTWAVPGSALPLWCQYTNCASSVGSKCFQAIGTCMNSVGSSSHPCHCICYIGFNRWYFNVSYILSSSSYQADDSYFTYG